MLMKHYESVIIGNVIKEHAIYFCSSHGILQNKFKFFSIKINFFIDFFNLTLYNKNNLN